MSENFIENRRKSLEEEINAKIPSVVDFHWSETDTETILIINLPSYGHKFTVIFYSLDNNDNYPFRVKGPFKMSKMYSFTFSSPIDEIAKTIIKLYLDQIQEEKRKFEKEKYWSFSSLYKDATIRFIGETDGKLKYEYKRNHTFQWYSNEK